MNVNVVSIISILVVASPWVVVVVVVHCFCCREYSSSAGEAARRRHQRRRHRRQKMSPLLCSVCFFLFFGGKGFEIFYFSVAAVRGFGYLSLQKSKSFFFSLFSLSEKHALFLHTFPDAYSHSHLHTNNIIMSSAVSSYLVLVSLYLFFLLSHSLFLSLEFVVGVL